jgi:hypothetical protein
MSCSYHDLVDVLGHSCLGVDGVLERLVAGVPRREHVQQVAGTSVHTFTHIFNIHYSLSIRCQKNLAS